MNAAAHNELTPCPFCGAQPHVIPDDSYDGCHVGCNCEHEPGIHLNKNQLDEAKRRWNRRTLVTEHDETLPK